MSGCLFKVVQVENACYAANLDFLGVNRVFARRIGLSQKTHLHLSKTWCYFPVPSQRQSQWGFIISTMQMKGLIITRPIWCM